MNITAIEFLRALNATNLVVRAEKIEPDRVPRIVVTIGQDTITRLICFEHAAPFVTLNTEFSVVIHSSPPVLGGGFSVECDDLDEATRVAKLCKDLIAREYAKLFT